MNSLQEEYCGNIKCRLCDEHDVRYPNTDTLTPLVTTYVREARQRRVCDRNATECPFRSPFQTVLPHTSLKYFLVDLCVLSHMR